ncbi:MAG TPA: hypothetical protein VGL81_28450 [Polyangiaceae bacterium]
MRPLPGLVGACSIGLIACGAAPVPCPAGAPPTLAPTVTAPPAPAVPPAPEADVTLRLLPATSPARVHVEVTFALPGAGPSSWSIARGAVERVTHATGHDAAGDLGVQVTAGAAGIELRLARPSKGAVTVAYDVLAGGDAPDDPLGVLVLDDRFRGAGESLVALPVGAEQIDVPKNTLIRIDGEALRAPGAASSVGVGAARRTTLAPGSLRGLSFMAGSLGVEVIDDPATGHDEGAWLGYTAFDPRPTVAEIAQIRSSLRELLKSGEDPGAYAYLVVAQTRPLGSFTTTPRVRSILLQVGPSEPWGAGLRLSVAQQLVRRWIGGALAVSRHEPEGWWFGEGVSRYVAMLDLARIGLLTPDEVRDAVAGELSVLATSPHRSLDNAHLSALAAKDEVARATLMARGALYALDEAAVLRTKSKGQHSLADVLRVLLVQAEGLKQHDVPLSTWLGVVGKNDPDAEKTFDALVTRGEPIALPPDALGPCFRASAGEYTAFDPGFDLEAARASSDGKVSGVRPDGPAAKAGLKDGDLIESMQARDGDATAPMKLSVQRAGTKVTLSFLPRGARGRGQVWSRVKLPDDRCGDPP